MISYFYKSLMTEEGRLKKPKKQPPNSEKSPVFSFEYKFLGAFWPQKLKVFFLTSKMDSMLDFNLDLFVLIRILLQKRFTCDISIINNSKIKSWDWNWLAIYFAHFCHLIFQLKTHVIALLSPSNPDCVVKIRHAA